MYLAWFVTNKHSANNYNADGKTCFDYNFCTYCKPISTVELPWPVTND